LNLFQCCIVRLIVNHDIMALRQFLSTSFMNNIRSHMRSPIPPYSSLVTSTIQPIKGLHHSKYSTTSVGCIEFTQGGTNKVGSHFIQPETWKNPSSSSKNVIYTTQRSVDNQYTCDCPGFRFRKSCRHVENAKRAAVQNAATALPSSSLVLGIDEAGAGPVIGPMIFCAVVVSKEIEEMLKSEGVKDSKDVPPKKREILRKLVLESCHEYHTIVVHASDIDQRRKDGESMNQIKVSTQFIICVEGSHFCNSFFSSFFTSSIIKKKQPGASSE
jgi:hypothetical protein